MPTALICTEQPLDDELGGTLLWRDDILQRVVGSAPEAHAAALADLPEIIVVDRDVPGATLLIAELRREAATRSTSIVIVARSEFEPVEVELLEAGANAVLRLPAGPEWDDRLARLIAIPVRRDVRFSVNLELEARTGHGVQMAPAVALNLSENGMLIETTCELTVGDDLDLSFALPDLLGTVVGCARVVRHAGRFRYGLEFYGLEGDGAGIVRQYVELIESRPQKL
jgi:DNA-binding response OmpR family regulator